MEINEILSNVFQAPLGNVSSELGVLRIGIALLFGMALASVYRITHSGISYSSSFAFTILTATFLSCAIIIIVGENVARAFALVGALAIIRFRTVIKDPKDLTFIFAGLVVGMAVGSGLILISFTVSVLLTAVSLAVRYSKILATDNFEHILRFSSEDNDINFEDIQTILNKTINKYQLLGYEKLSDSKGSSATFEITAISQKQFNEMKNDMMKLSNKVAISFVTGNSNITY